MGQHRPSIGQHRPNIGPTWAQDEPNIAQHRPNLGQYRPKMGPTWLNMGPTWPNTGGPDCFHTGKLCALCLPQFNIALPGFAQRISAQSSHTIRQTSLLGRRPAVRRKPWNIYIYIYIHDLWLPNVTLWLFNSLLWKMAHSNPPCIKNQ